MVFEAFVFKDDAHMLQYWLTDLTTGEGLQVDADTIERVLGVEISYINWVLENDGVYENRKWRVEIGETAITGQ